MILITGASGKTGRAILGQLEKRGGACNVRALVRCSDQVAQVEALGASEAVVGDLRNVSDLRNLMSGVETIYHICPNMHPSEVAIGEALLEVAKSSGVCRIVYHSVLHPQTQEMRHHWHKLLVEEMLFKSGLNYTILQPAAYMQNVLAGWSDILAKGIYRVPYHPETMVGMVDLVDVAEVAALVIGNTGHDGAIYELATNERLTQRQCAAIMARVLGHPVEVIETSHAEWRLKAENGGLSRFAIDTLLDMFRYYEEYGFFGNATVVTALLGREPTSFEAFLRRISKASGE